MDMLEELKEITVEVTTSIILIVLFIFSSTIYQYFIKNSNQLYIATVSVKSKKIDGKTWDIRGGYPDILLKVDRKKINFNKSCKNTYKCKIQFESNSNSWYIELYDKDLISSDIIGNGTCKINESCEIGLAKVFITEI